MKPIMKAYQIHSDIVAAFNVAQAIGTWAAHKDVEPETAGAVTEIDPATYMLSFEKNDGTYEDGTLAEIMPESDPEVVIDGDEN